MQEIIKVGIFETDVFGAKAYHCRCLNCGWQTKRKDIQAEAVKAAKAHRCKAPQPKESK